MYKKYIKRALDLVLSIAFSPIFILIMLPFMVLIKLEDGGPIFYKSWRLGKDFKKYPMYKLRTMKVDAEDIRNPDGSTFNSKNDDRVTKVGSFLRKSSIDELPQILNVIKGDMSIVGVRPSPLGNENTYSKQYLQKFNYRPGITGYNQALCRNGGSNFERIKNDLFYTNNISFLLDVKIILMTFSMLLKTNNVYRNNDGIKTEFENKQYDTTRNMNKGKGMQF